MNRPYHRHGNLRWQRKDIALLHKLVRERTPVRIIAMRLGRSVHAVYTRMAVFAGGVKAMRREHV